MLRVLIVDDYAIVRHGVKRILQRAFDDLVVGEAESGTQTLRQVQEAPWDIVLLDLSLPDRHGLEILPEIRRLAPRTPVLVFTLYPEDAFGRRLFKLGAAGYLPKKSNPRELVEAVQKVLAGGRYIRPALAEQLASVFGHSDRLPRHELLSDREFQVLRLISLGGTPKSIGHQLGLSDKTISTFRRNILHKLGLVTNEELVRYALEHGLVAPAELRTLDPSLLTELDADPPFPSDEAP